MTPSCSPKFLVLTCYDPNNQNTMKKDEPCRGRMKGLYCSRKRDEKISYKKRRFYCSTCSDYEKRIFNVKSTLYVQWFSLLLCFPPFHNLLYLLNSYLWFFPCSVDYSMSQSLCMLCLIFWLSVVFIDSLYSCDYRPVI